MRCPFRRLFFTCLGEGKTKMKTHTPQTAATHVEPFTSSARAISRADKESWAVAFFRCDAAGGRRGGGAGTIRAGRFRPERKRRDPRRRRPSRTARYCIGGELYARFGRCTRNHIARLNPDGTLDTAFDPNADNFVLSFAVQPDGKVLAGGSFTSIGGQTRNSIARLDAATGLADSWDPNANGFCPFNRGAGGRQDFSGRLFHHYRRTDA